MKNSCGFCHYSVAEYPVEVSNNGITERKLVCEDCKKIIEYRKENNFTTDKALKDYFDGGGAIEDLPVETRLKIAETTDPSDRNRDQNEEHTLDTECPNWFN